MARLKIRQWVVIVLAGCTIAAATENAGAQDAASRLGPEAGRVTYRMIGGPAESTMLWQWADHGMRFRQDIDMMAGPQKVHFKTWTISDGKAVYLKMPMSENQAFKREIPKDPKVRRRMEERGMSQLGMPMSPGSKGKVIGHAIVAGKPCEVRQINAQKVWFWNNVPLKVEIHRPNAPVMTMVATRVETGMRPSPGLFKVPAGITVRPMSEMAGAMGMGPGGRAMTPGMRPGGPRRPGGP